MRRAEGSIVRHGDGWRVFATRRDSAGNVTRPSKVVHGTRKDAERVLREMTGYREAPRSVGELCDLYLEHCEGRVERGEMEASTLRGYRSAIESHIRPHLGRLSDPRPVTIRRMVDSLPENRLSVYKTLRQMYRWAYRLELVESNPMDRVQSPPANPPAVGRDGVYTREEVAKILSWDMEDWLRLAVAIALGCGLRRGEVCGLDWEDYDGERLDVSKAYGKNRPKTPNGNRAVSVPGFARAVLDEFEGSGPMISKGGLRIHPDTLSHAWRRECERRGMRYLPFKNLRHTSLTMAYEATGDLLAVSRRAGHSSVYITDRFYARPSQEVDEEVSKKMDTRVCEDVRTFENTMIN